MALAIRAELADDLGDRRLAHEMLAVDERIDGMALAAVDLYVECREKVAELRINEVKRRVSWVVDRLGRGEAGGQARGNTDAAPLPAEADSVAVVAGERGGERGGER